MYNFLIIIVLFFSRHPMHLGVTEINHNQTTNTFEISHKLFYDDLEDAIERSYKIKLNLNTKKESDKTVTYLQQYLEANFVVLCNGSRQKPTYVGYEYEEEAIWIYYELKPSTPQGVLQITNRSLMNLYDDQNNFLHFQQGSQRQSLRYNFENQTQTVNF